MSLRLTGTRVLVTAAGQGIGRAAALAIAAEGADVVATDRNPTAMTSLSTEAQQRGYEIACTTLDVLRDQEIEESFAGSKPFDALFNCAGFVHEGRILETSDDDWEFSFRLNVRSMFKVTRFALPFMLERRSGSIINMASVCSSVKGLPNRFAYGTTKAAVIGMTKSIAADFVGDGIRCNAICPGTVDTPSLNDRMKQVGDSESVRQMYISRQPMGRLAKPDEIASLVVYLASRESAFVTGQAFCLDGGITI